MNRNGKWLICLLPAVVSGVGIAAFLVYWLAGGEARESDAAVGPELVRADTEFGFKLFKELVGRDDSKNVFISPSSLALALTMTYNGASGKTRQAMAKALQIRGIDLQQVNEANAALLANMNGPGPGVTLNVANSLWARQDVEFDADFLQRNREFYSAEVTALDFGRPDALDIINGWVADKTEGKIDEVIGTISPGTVLFLINAIYFKGAWEDPFDPARTRKGTFTLTDGAEKTVPMMSRHGDYNYLQTDTFQAIRLPYGKGRLSMYVFLPSKELGLRGFYKELHRESWESWMSLFSETKGSISLPRFRVEYEVEQALKEALTALGMGVAFSRSADFSAMIPGGGVWIERVIHKTFLEVNEEGTEAAAATAVEMLGVAIRQPFDMVVDRPFFCAIRDDKTGVILFMGSIVDPG